MGPARILAIACIALGLLIYVAAVAGLLFAKATPPGDVGALSTLASFLLFGILAFLLDRQPGRETGAGAPRTFA
jgi:hypothetical protein